MKNNLIKIVASILMFLITLFISEPLIKKILFIIAYLIVGFNVLKKSIKNILKGEIFDENFLMSIATLGAFLIGEDEEALAVMLFYQIGELFNDYAVDKSKKSISKLMDIRPDYANLCIDDDIKKVDPSSVKIGDIIIVKPGEKIPLDGTIISGDTMIDTHALTGEAVLKHATINQDVLSGCINVNGVIKIEVKKKFKESTVNKILELVENASNKKSKSESFITRFSKIYTPIVVFIAVLLVIIPTLLNGNFSQWFYRALSFLVVSCPCALVISIPLSFFCGIGSASKIGVLVKGSNYLEKLAKTDIVVCDKTGTLTEGVFEVQKINTKKLSDEKLLMYAAYAENYSNHPISLSLKKAYNKKIDEDKIKDFKEILSRGVKASIDGKKVLVGNEQMMIENKIDFEKNNDIGTICYIAIDNQFSGSILISDKIKDDAYETIKMLKKYGVKRFIMLTGDRKKIALDVSNKLNIDECYYELLPNDKVLKVEELLKIRKNNLIFIGDGINDAPVITIADIGISMGGIGSDAAIEASDIVLMTDELSKIPKTINIAKKTLKIVKENIIFIITVKVIVLLLSAIGISTMWEAVFADVGVSVISVLNAFRILKTKK